MSMKRPKGGKDGGACKGLHDGLTDHRVQRPDASMSVPKASVNADATRTTVAPNNTGVGPRSA
jgi:hypothetical protein